MRLLLITERLRPAQVLEVFSWPLCYKMLLYVFCFINGYPRFGGMRFLIFYFKKLHRIAFGM